MNARRRIAKRKDWPANLYQKLSGYFWYKNPASGKSKGLGHDRATAFREARAANNALANIAQSSLADWVTGKPKNSLAEWLPIYNSLWLEKKTPAKATIDNNRGYIRAIEQADFAWMNVSDISAQHVATFLDGIEEKRGANIALSIRSRLSDVFRMAEAKGMIESGKNPVTVTYAPEKKVVRDRLSIEQFHAIRAAAPVWLANAMLLALLTGQRRDDIANMKFSDIKEGYLHIIQGKSQGQTKLRFDTSIRLAAVNMSIEDAIRQCRDSVITKHMVHHIKTMANYKAGNKVTAAGLTNAFASARVAANIVASEGKTLPTFHEIRSLAERLYKSEYDAAFAQSILGHRNAKMTAVYDDLRGSDYQEIKAK